MGKVLFMRKGETHTVPSTRLPSGYTELAYIQSSGTQYIDTGFKPNQNTGVTIDFQLNVASGWQCVFGTRVGNNTRSYSLWHSGSAFGFYYSNVNATFSNLGGTVRHTVVASKNTAVADGASSVSPAYSNFTANYPLFLFAVHSDGQAQSIASMKLYSCQIYDNGTLVRDYVPCINDSGVVGLFDMVERKFYGNAGTGTFEGDGTPSPTGIVLANIAEGSLVNINEDGSPVEFYVAKHDYESGLNGAGRTLLVRKGVHSSQKWGTNPTYGSSLIDTWFNGTYKAMLDAAVQSAIGTTKFYNIPSNSTNTASAQTRSVFALSTDELGSTLFTKAAEGSALPIASALASAGVSQWTRSPVRNAAEAYAFYANGNCVGAGVTNAFGARPCFTLPVTSMFDEETLLFKGVS